MCPYTVRGDTPVLYTVLPEKMAAVGGAMMGSAHVYDLAAVGVSPWIDTNVLFIPHVTFLL